MKTKNQSSRLYSSILLVLICAIVGFALGYAVVSYTGGLTPEQSAVQNGAQPVE